MKPIIEESVTYAIYTTKLDLVETLFGYNKAASIRRFLLLKKRRNENLILTKETIRSTFEKVM